VGWLAGDAEVLARALVWREQVSLALAGPATAAVRALWPRRAEIAAANRAVVARNRATVLAWLAERPWAAGAPSPHAGCFLLGVADGWAFDDVAAASRWYAQDQVLAIPGTVVGFPRTLRVGFGHRDEAGLAAGLGYLDDQLRP
jgi:aspartate/methionine/tyrosine aminotransferase